LNLNNIKARIRYRQALQDVSVIKNSEFYCFNFKRPQKAISSGQFIALYENEELICSGVID
jgi:tRNA-specific 2-thiouridylase